MKAESKKEKEKPGFKKYLIGQYIANLIGVLISSLLLVYVIFVFFGNEDKAGSLAAVQVFMLIFIPFFTLIQPVGAIGNMRRDFLHGKWVMDDREPSSGPDSVINPWRRVGLAPLIIGIVVTGAMCLAIQVIITGPFNLLTINILVFVPTLILSTIFIWRCLPRDRVPFTDLLAGSRPEKPDPFLRYFLVEHALPWAFLQAIINMGFGIRVFGLEALKTGGEIASVTVATDAGFTTWFLLFFMWLASQAQVRPDIHLGRVSRSQGKGPAVPLMLLLFVALSVVMAVVAGAALWVAGIESMTVYQATVIKMFVAMVTASAGCWLGIWWGKRRESRLILDQASDR